MPWWTASPTIVAEALVAVPDPLLTALRPGPQACPTAVAASLAQSLSPAEDPAPAPVWLYPEQARSFRRALAAVRRHGGAVLADPVGSGKTYVALAIAAAFNRGSTTACLVPATLLCQWKTAAASLGVAVALGSHEQASRGKLPTRTRGLVIIDESHWFRNRLTRRYSHVAEWLAGRPTLLVTATPVVNRLSDLANQLLLAVRDNALALDGIASLRTLLASGCASAAVGQLVIEADSVSELRPRKASTISVPGTAECASISRSIETLHRLRLSRNESIAALVRGVLLRAAGSSPAALAGSLQRYRRLLFYAQEAFQTGRSMKRSELRRFTNELGDQLVWWELLPSSGAASELDFADLEELESLIRAARAAANEPDAKLCRLRKLLAETQPTLVFTYSRDTVRYIRERLGDLRLAWCTGDRAGLGHTALPRAVVLGWFREGVTGPVPHHLVVTDVAAEGLDLQRAARVVHYDLPWTPMRLEQREGRAIRLGSRHSEVEVVRFAPPTALERVLRLEATLVRKGRLPTAAGLGASGRHIWRWRAELARSFTEPDALAGVATVACSPPGILAGFSLYRTGDPETCLASAVGWIGRGSAWTEVHEIVSERLLTAAQNRALPVEGERLRESLELVTVPIRERLALTRGRHWVAADPAPSARKLASRIHGLIRSAARLRQADRLLRLQRVLEFVTGGHTAGEAVLIERLAESADVELEARLSRMAPTRREWDGIDVRLTGLIVFDPNASP